jgi:hypothetical protein
VAFAAALVFGGCGADAAKRELEERGAENLGRCLEDRGVVAASEAVLRALRDEDVHVQAIAGPSAPPAVVSFSVSARQRRGRIYVVWSTAPRPEFEDVVSGPEQYPFIGVTETGSLADRRAAEGCLV